MVPHKSVHDRIKKLENEKQALQISLKEMTIKYDKLRRGNIDESKYIDWGYDEITDWIVSLDERERRRALSNLILNH